MLGQGADQFLNAPVLARSGAGLFLVPAGATSERIAEATARLLDEPHIAAAARQMQHEVMEMPSADVVLAQTLGSMTGVVG